MIRAASLLLLLAACGPKIPPGPSAAAQAEAPVRLLTLPADSGPDVYFEAIVAAGAAYDPTGKEGLAALTAHAMVEAGAGDRSGEAVKEALYPTGNTIHTVVDREWVSFRLTCHKDQAKQCLDVFTDVLVDPRFDAPDVKRVRDDALYDVTKGLMSSEEALGRVLIDDALYEGHPYGHPIEGRAGVLPLLDDSAARAFYDRHYVREAVLAGLAGAWDDPLRQAFQDELDQLPQREKPELVLPPQPTLHGRDLVAVDTGGKVTGFHIAEPIDVTRKSIDWPALYLGVEAFGAHRQTWGRLFRALRETRGLNYGDYAYMEPFVQRGGSTLPEQGVLRREPAFEIWIRPTSLANGPFALKLALDELGKLVKTGLTAGELDATRSWLLGHVPLEARNPGRRLAYALDAEATGTPNVLDYLPKVLPSLTLDQVNAALKRHLDPANLEIVAVTGDAKDLVDALESDAPTPIVYQGVSPSKDQAARDTTVAAEHLDLAHTTILPAENILR